MNVPRHLLKSYIQDSMEWNKMTPEERDIEEARIRYINKPPRLSESERQSFLKRRYYGEKWDDMKFKKASGNLLQIAQLGIPKRLAETMGSSFMTLRGEPVSGLEEPYAYILMDDTSKRFLWGSKAKLSAEYGISNLELKRVDDGSLNTVRVSGVEFKALKVYEISSMPEMIKYLFGEGYATKLPTNSFWANLGALTGEVAKRGSPAMAQRAPSNALPDMAKPKFRVNKPKAPQVSNQIPDASAPPIDQAPAPGTSDVYIDIPQESSSSAQRIEAKTTEEEAAIEAMKSNLDDADAYADVFANVQKEDEEALAEKTAQEQLGKGDFEWAENFSEFSMPKAMVQMFLQYGIDIVNIVKAKVSGAQHSYPTGVKDVGPAISVDTKAHVEEEDPFFMEKELQDMLNKDLSKGYAFMKGVFKGIYKTFANIFTASIQTGKFITEAFSTISSGLFIFKFFNFIWLLLGNPLEMTLNFLFGAGISAGLISGGLKLTGWLFKSSVVYFLMYLKWIFIIPIGGYILLKIIQSIVAKFSPSGTVTGTGKAVMALPAIAGASSEVVGAMQAINDTELDVDFVRGTIRKIEGSGFWQITRIEQGPPPSDLTLALEKTKLTLDNAAKDLVGNEWYNVLANLQWKSIGMAILYTASSAVAVYTIYNVIMGVRESLAEYAIQQQLETDDRSIMRALQGVDVKAWALTDAGHAKFYRVVEAMSKPENEDYRRRFINGVKTAAQRKRWAELENVIDEYFQQYGQ